ncbi:MAG: glycosyltransferase [Planctomycetota bacterium]
MRILFLLHQFLPRHVTGTEQYARSLAIALRARGHDVRVFAYEPLIQFAAPGRLWFEQDEVVDGVPVHRISVHPTASPNPVLIDIDNPLAVQLFERYLDREPFDLVHVFHPRYLGCGGLAALHRRRLPFVVNLMDFYYICPNYTLLRGDGSLCDGPPRHGLGCADCIDPQLGDLVQSTGIEDHALALAGCGSMSMVGTGGTELDRVHTLLVRRERLLAALRPAAAILAPSRFLARMYEANGLPGARMRHVPYGVDPERFAVAGSADGDTGEASRAEETQGESARPIRLGYIGSITPHKGLHTVLPVLRGLHGSFRFDVYGSFETHPEYASQVRALAGRDRRIRFRGAFASERLGQVLARLDALVVPSLWYENTPFVVLEALWAGVPVLASDLGGIAEVVQDGVNGRLFAPGDADSLRTVLESVLADRRQLATFRDGPRPRPLSENVDELQGIYADVVAAGSEGAP